MTGNSQVPKDVLLANLRQLAPEIFTETKNQYQKRVGDKDEEGYMTREGMFRKNSRENGQYHSNWLNMMYPRLFLARNLLRDDGVIFVSELMKSFS
jgi:adenine-specific DNA-methyltransferase